MAQCGRNYHARCTYPRVVAFRLRLAHCTRGICCPLGVAVNVISGEIGPKETRARGMGWLYSGNNLGVVLAAAVGGYLSNPCGEAHPLQPYVPAELLRSDFGLLRQSPEYSLYPGGSSVVVVPYLIVVALLARS